jgi:hypothetical protein
MALTNLSTPGVYVQEINTLPASIASVATAIPGFLGYTEKTIINGNQWDYSTGPAPAIRITSIMEFQEAFGGPFHEHFDVVLDLNGNPTITPDSVTTPANSLSPYTLFYHMQMYFANGGGPCHIIAVGNYDYSGPIIDAQDFYDPADPTIGLGVAETIDEITLLVAPEVIEIIDNLGASDPSAIQSVYNAMLAQCNKLKDRFSIFDLVSTGAPVSDSSSFRNSYIGSNYLNYGAAYYPPLSTTLFYNASDDDVVISADNRGVTNLYDSPPNDRLSTILQGIGTFDEVIVSNNPSAGDTLIVNVGSTTVTLFADTDFLIGATQADTALNIIAAINSNAVLAPIARAQSSTSAQFFIVARQGSSTQTVSFSDTGGWTSQGTPGTGVDNSADTALYNKIKTALAALTKLTLAPSATMAGIYAAVDNDRGVWKAPANVGITGIVGPSVTITEAQQGDMNVDATSGKSINAIRSFVGRGTLVWGARTLEGNSNEWRYVPVRRLFIFVEESTKKASEFVVFEPNDKNTWLRVKGMITNFLTDLWKSGALAGDKPEQAFFVRVGLGDTMTAQDILEGKMIVVIGMAAVRPAEFIILQFEHKLQEA